MRRTTRQLSAVLRVLETDHSHPTAREVFDHVRRVVPRVSRGTVYRNLAKLQTERRVNVVRFVGRPLSYDATTEDHDHFVCERCGKIADLEATGRKAAADSAIVAAGYVVERQSTTYYGVCPPCVGTRIGGSNEL